MKTAKHLGMIAGGTGEGAVQCQDRGCFFSICLTQVVFVFRADAA